MPTAFAPACANSSLPHSRQQASRCSGLERGRIWRHPQTALVSAAVPADLELPLWRRKRSRATSSGARGLGFLNVIDLSKRHPSTPTQRIATSVGAGQCSRERRREFAAAMASATTTGPPFRNRPLEAPTQRPLSDRKRTETDAAMRYSDRVTFAIGLDRKKRLPAHTYSPRLRR